MSLVNVKKKNIKTIGDYPDGIWEKRTYDKNGNEIYRECSNGSWFKFIYDDKGNKIPFLTNILYASTKDK
jgi:hypothetical protein